MAKIVIKKLLSPTARSVGSKGVAVHKKTFAGPNGPRQIITIKTGSETFTEDLTYAFGRNIAKARRENKRVTGELDGSPAKA